MKTAKWIVVLSFTLLGGALFAFTANSGNDTQSATQSTDTNTNLAVAIFAGGCFWCVESDFDKVDGVHKTISGYTGGTTANPDYKQVSRGNTGHIEAVEIHFDPSVVSYESLLNKFWRTVDPVDAGGQFCDRGESYQTAIFAVTPEQKQLALKSKAAIDDAGVLPKAIVTPVIDASTFYPAEDYHQDYYKKNPARYKFYRYSCGRDQRVTDLWSGVPEIQ